MHGGPPLPRVPGKTVYILGSGFSAGLGIPTIANFVPDGLRLLWRPKPLDIVTRTEALLHRYGPMLRPLVEGEANLEDFFCAADAAGDADDRNTLVRFVCAVCSAAYARHQSEVERIDRETHQLPRDARFLPTVPRAAAWVDANGYEAVSEWQTEHLPVACVYEAFLSQVFIEAAQAEAAGRAGPAIISLNYDLVLEHKLKPWSKTRAFHYGSGFTPAPEEACKKVPLIKPHGSLNWRKGAGDTVRVLPPAKACESVSLIMPSWVQESVVKGLRGRLLREALTHLREADRIVVIGYSMPATDRYLRFFLANALDTPEQPTIEIHSRLKPEETLERGRAMFGRRPTIPEPDTTTDLITFLRSHKLP